TKTGATMGTYSYMAPEQRISAKRAGPASDMYSLCASLYVLLTDGNPAELYEPERQDRLFSALHPDLNAFLRRGCHYEFTQRFQNMQTLIEVLLEVQQTVDKPQGLSPISLFTSNSETAITEELDDIQRLFDKRDESVGSMPMDTQLQKSLTEETFIEQPVVSIPSSSTKNIMYTRYVLMVVSILLGIILVLWLRP
ncbi:MAG: hypothetical protein VX278_18110, partial [Myxococcota bacterium]|nr:hypothetical protein [Myxococcota bacterium]